MAKAKQKGEKRVKIRLYKDRGNFAQDVTVIVNGKAYLIQRGVEVEVPESVAEVLANADEQRGYAVDYMEGLSREFENKQKTL